MSPTLKAAHVSILGLCISLLCSCAFGTRHVTLSYPPEKQPEGSGTKTVDAASVPADGRSLLLMQFVDQRSNKGVIGEVRNGYGMRTADVVADNDVTEWVTNAVKMELEKTGYEVAVVNNIDQTPSGLIVQGELLQVYCTALFTYEAEVSFFAQFRKDGKEIFRNRYTGKGSAGLNWAMTASSSGYSLAEALSVAIKTLVDDINSSIKAKEL